MWSAIKAEERKQERNELERPLKGRILFSEFYLVSTVVFHHISLITSGFLKKLGPKSISLRVGFNVKEVFSGVSKSSWSHISTLQDTRDSF